MKKTLTNFSNTKKKRTHGFLVRMATRRPSRPEQEAGEGKEETGGVVPRGWAKGRSGRPRERGGKRWKARPLAKMSAFGKDRDYLRSTSRGFELFGAFHHHHVPESIGDQKTGHDGQQESGKLRTEKQDQTAFA